MHSPRILATAALAVAGLWSAGAAQAADVSWSVTIGSSGPVYPTPAIVHPAPVLWPAPVVVNPAPVLVTYPRPVYQPAYPSYPTYRYDRHHDHGRHHDHNRGDRGYRAPTGWDRDGDGIPNRADRVYNPRWDRDGDGVPNGRDRFVRNPYRH